MECKLRRRGGSHVALFGVFDPDEELRATHTLPDHAGREQREAGHGKQQSSEGQHRVSEYDSAGQSQARGTGLQASEPGGAAASRRQLLAGAVWAGVPDEVWSALVGWPVPSGRRAAEGNARKSNKVD